MGAHASHGAGFGAILRDLRRQAGLTQRALSLRSGVAERTISDLERGVSTFPHATTLHLLLEALALDDSSRARLLEAVEPRVAQPPPVPDTALLAGRAWTERRRTLWGRDALLDRVCAALRPGAVVTLTGTGGIGKSRLAQAAAARLAAAGDAVIGVSLDRLAPGEDAAAAIARAAAAGDAGESVERLAAALAGRPLLLLLDNADAAPAAAGIVAALAAAAPDLRVLVTSRARLGVAGETALTVPPLPAPAARDAWVRDPHGLAANPAVALFRERARQAGAPADDFPLAAVADLVSRLDGIPLAIELAAAQSVRLSPAALLAMLDRGGLDLLERPGLDRQARMDWVIDASVIGLDPTARDLFAIAAAFTAGFTVDALSAVAAGIGAPGLVAELPALVRASLVHETDDPGRFEFLEPVRMHATRLLALSGREERVREAHARWAVGVARRVAGGAFGPRVREALAVEAIDRGNLLSAFHWAAASGREDLAAAVGAPLYRIWEAAFVNTELHATLDALCERSSAIADPGNRAFTLFFTAYSMNMCGDVSAARARIAQLRAAMPGDPVAVGLAALAESLTGTTEPARIGPVIAESARLLEDARHPMAWAAEMRLGVELQLAGRAAEGIALVRGVLDGMERAGNLFDQPVPMLQLGISLTDAGQVEEARAVYRRMIELCRRLGFDHALFRALMGYADAAMRDRSPAAARSGALALGAANALSVRSGMPQVGWWERRLVAARAEAERLLGAEPVAWLVEEGRSMPPAEAARLALGR